jgi:hypothetical protein
MSEHVDESTAPINPNGLARADGDGFRASLAGISDKIGGRTWPGGDTGMDAVPPGGGNDCSSLKNSAAAIIFPEPVPISHVAKRAGRKIEWVWEGYLPRGGMTLLTALWKVGKTTLLTHLFRAFCRKEKMFCGRLLIPSKVLIVSQEPDAIWAKRRQQHGLKDAVAHFQGGDSDYPQPFKVKPNHRQWESLVAHLAARVKPNDYGLVVIDPIADFWPVENENDASEVTAALLPLRQITHAGANLLLLHHPRKSGGKEGTAPRGSGALMGTVEVLMEMERVRPNDLSNRERLIRAVSRYDETPKQLVIELTKEGYVARGSRTEAAADRYCRQILNILPSSAPGLTVPEIREKWPEGFTKPSGTSLRNVLREGEKQGKWVRTGSGARNDAGRYHRASS